MNEINLIKPNQKIYWRTPVFLSINKNKLQKHIKLAARSNDGSCGGGGGAGR